MTCAGHVLHDDIGITRQVFSHEQGDPAGIQIVKIARPSADDYRHRFPLEVWSLSASETGRSERNHYRTKEHPKHTGLPARLGYSDRTFFIRSITSGG